MRNRWTASLIALCIVALSACNAEKRRLTERLEALEQQHAGVSRRLLRQQHALKESDDRLRALKVDLATHNTETQTYVQQHQIAAGCIQAARIQFGDDDAFSNDAARYSSIGTVVCSLALLNGTFSREVRQVAAKIAEAEARAKELQQQMDVVEKTVSNQRAALDAERIDADNLAAQLEDVRNRLARE